MNIDDLTLRQIKEIKALIIESDTCITSGLSLMIDSMVIIRTYSAGVWFGKLKQQDGKEVILENARRMYRWWAKESISLSAVSIHGIKRDKSKICEAVSYVWLEAIEIIPCTQEAINSIGGAENAKAG